MNHLPPRNFSPNGPTYTTFRKPAHKLPIHVPMCLADLSAYPPSEALPRQKLPACAHLQVQRPRDTSAATTKSSATLVYHSAILPKVQLLRVMQDFYYPPYPWISQNPPTQVSPRATPRMRPAARKSFGFGPLQMPNPFEGGAWLNGYGFRVYSN